MENKTEKRMHAQQITNFFHLFHYSKKLSFKNIKILLRTLKVY